MRAFIVFSCLALAAAKPQYSYNAPGAGVGGGLLSSSSNSHGLALGGNSLGGGSLGGSLGGGSLGGGSLGLSSGSLGSSGSNVLGLLAPGNY